MSQTGTKGITEVAPGVFGVDAPFWGYPLSLYFVGDKEWAVVDTGVVNTPSESIAPFMEARGGVEALTLVLGTHGHVDHVGGNGAMRALNPDVRFTLPEVDIPWAESPTRHYLQLYKACAPGEWDPDPEFEAAVVGAFGEPTTIDMPLSDGQTVECGDGRTIEVVHVGAHSPGHVIFIDRSADVAFIGDIIQGPGSLNNESGLRAFPLYTPVTEYRTGLASVRKAGVSHYCTAHEGVLSAEEAEAAIEASLKWADDFHAFVGSRLTKREPVTLTQVVSAVAEHMPGYEQVLQIHATTMAHLDELVRTGDAETHMEGGRKAWTAAG